MFCLELFISVFLNLIIKRTIVLVVTLLKKTMTDIRDSDKIYHGCFNKNKNGTNKLIIKGERCLTPTHSPFWKCPWDIPNGVITRAQEKKTKKITIDKFIKYFQNIEIFKGG